MFSNEKVLVVDDIETNQFLLKEVLSKVGIDILTASNGYEALNICKSIKPDLVIMDLFMPVMDGFEASNDLKINPEFCNIPIIALSASITKVDPENGDFDELLMKPVDIKQLLKILAKYFTNIGEKESFVLSKFEVRNLTVIEPEVFEDLRKITKPILRNLKGSIIISNVKNLASLLISFGTEHQLEFIQVEGEELMKYADSCNIIEMKSKLEQIEQLILEDD
jgi:CheY-like chemotaxis protein